MPFVFAIEVTKERRTRELEGECRQVVNRVQSRSGGEGRSGEESHSWCWSVARIEI